MNYLRKLLNIYTQNYWGEISKVFFKQKYANGISEIYLLQVYVYECYTWCNAATKVSDQTSFYCNGLYFCTIYLLMGQT